MAAPRIRNRNNLEDWLRDRKREDAVVIAARAALRVLPLTARVGRKGADERAERRLVALTLATFRASASARFAGKYPTRAAAARAAAARAAEFAAAALTPVFVNVAQSDAASAAAFASAVAASAADSAADAAAAASASASASAVWTSVARDAALLESVDATALASSALWDGGVPNWAENAWVVLRFKLPPSQNWVVWVEWYEAILAGHEPWPSLDPKTRENLEVEIVSLPNRFWEEGPAAVNSAIAALIKAAHTPTIAAQGPGPRFALGDHATIVPVEYREYDGEGNIPKRIKSLLPLTRRAAQDLSASLPSNDPHNLARDTREYLAVIDRDIRRIDWAVVYGLGVFIENAADEAEREIADRLLPPLEGPAKKALDSLRTVHSNLIMASGEGRALQEEADALRLTREQHHALREDAETIAAGLHDDPDVATPAAAATVIRAARQMGQGPHPERGSEFGLAAIGNVSVVLVSAATLASFAPIGFAAGGAVGAAVGVGVAWVGYEGLKKSAIYANATAALGPRYDALQKTADEALRARLAALAPFRRFVRDNEAPLRRIAENTSRLRWMLHYIDFIMKPDGETGD